MDKIHKLSEDGQGSCGHETVMPEDSPRASFLGAITFALRDYRYVDELDRVFVRTLLQFGSETEDNTRCIERLGITRIRHSHGGDAVGFGIRGEVVSVVDILNSAEGGPLPDLVANEFPSVTQDDWDAVLRLAALVLTALEAAERSPD